jgi:integrase
MPGGDVAVTAVQPATPPDVATAALMVLRTMGVTIPELLEAEEVQQARGDVPTFAGYVPVVAAATPAGSASTWMPYWRVLVEQWGDRQITEPTASELRTLANWVQQRAATRPGARGGSGAKGSFISAVKRLYALAVDDRYLTAGQNPATQVKNTHKVQRPPRALSASELAQINQFAGSTGQDPELDALLVRLHTETACRRTAATLLRPCDLNKDQCTVLLREKGGTARNQPISRTLMSALHAHSCDRSPRGDAHGPLLRKRDGSPLTVDHYPTLWRRLGRHLPWLKHLGVTVHWLRYTTLTWVERNFGYAVAATYAGHETGNGRGGVTMTYVKATPYEVAAALAMLTAEPHPLAAGLPSLPAGEQSHTLATGSGLPEAGVLSRVQRHVSERGYIKLFGERFSVGVGYAWETVSVHVFRDRYLIALDDGHTHTFDRSFVHTPAGQDMSSDAANQIADWSARSIDEDSPMRQLTSPLAQGST